MLLLSILVLYPGDVTATRMLIYGCIFVFARYMHTFGYITSTPNARVVGFLLSFLTLAAMSLDLVIRLTDHRNDSPES